MKRISLLIIAVSALGRPAFAASPHVFGTYAFMSWSQCGASVQAPIQSVVVSATLGTVVTGATSETVLAPPADAPTTTNAVQAVTTNTGVTGVRTNSGAGPLSVPQPGLMSIGIGYIDFTPAANGGTSGTVTGSISNAGGATLDVNSNSPPWQTTSGTFSGSYSLNPTAGTLTLVGATYTAAYGNMDPVGIAHTMYLLVQNTQSNNPNCLQAIVATHQ